MVAVSLASSAAGLGCLGGGYASPQSARLFRTSSHGGSDSDHSLQAFAQPLPGGLRPVAARRDWRIIPVRCRRALATPGLAVRLALGRWLGQSESPRRPGSSARRDRRSVDPALAAQAPDSSAGMLMARGSAITAARLRSSRRRRIGTAAPVHGASTGAAVPGRAISDEHLDRVPPARVARHGLPGIEPGPVGARTMPWPAGHEEVRSIRHAWRSPFPVESRRAAQKGRGNARLDSRFPSLSPFGVSPAPIVNHQ